MDRLDRGSLLNVHGTDSVIVTIYAILSFSIIGSPINGDSSRLRVKFNVQGVAAANNSKASRKGKQEKEIEKTQPDWGLCRIASSSHSGIISPTTDTKEE